MNGQPVARGETVTVSVPPHEHTVAAYDAETGDELDSWTVTFATPDCPPPFDDLATFRVAISCDLIVLAVHNGGDARITPFFIADQDTIRGRVAGAGELLGQEPLLELPAEHIRSGPADVAVALPSAATLVDVVGLPAGGEGFAHVDPGETLAHGIEIREGMVFEVVLEVPTSELFDATFTYDDIAALLDCADGDATDSVVDDTDPGATTELAATGSRPALIAGGALLVLVLGIAMSVAARRRRAIFTV